MTSAVKYRVGSAQRATLGRLANTLEHPEATPELRDLIHAALAADIPATALADSLGISYSGLSSWVADPTPSAVRQALLPSIERLTKAIGLGMTTGALPIDGNHIAPVLALLVRLLTLRDERDAARAETVIALGAQLTKSGPASPETINSYDPDQ